MNGLEQFVVLAAVIAGVTELITRLRAKDLWTAVTIVTAVLIGALFGYLDYYPGLDIAEGVALGFGASGALTALSAVGNKTSAHPTSVTEKK